MKLDETIIECPKCGTRLRVKALLSVITCPSCKCKIPTTPKGIQLLKFLVTTTNNIDGAEITEYLGVISSQVVLGINFVRDILSSITDLIGGRSKTIENALDEARSTVIKELSKKALDLDAEAIVGFTLDYETMGQTNGMVMLVATGTAVKFVRKECVQQGAPLVRRGAVEPKSEPQSQDLPADGEP